MKFETQDRYDACAQHVFSGPDEDPNATPPTSTPADNDSYLVEDPVTGEVKALWKYDASESVWKEIKTGSGGPSYAKVVYLNSTTPSMATVFDLNSPPTTNNPALAQDSQNLYIATNGSAWAWDGSAYISAPLPTGVTPWDLFGTTIDAGRNTTSIIKRYADVIVNGLRVGRGSGNISTNTVIGGGGALSANTTGDNNVALGEYALGSNITGTSNFGTGFASLGNNTTGSFNVGLGRASLRWSVGSYNIGIGMQALSQSGMTGSSNIGFGYQSGAAIGGYVGLSSGSDNIFIGHGANNVSSGSSNVVIGAYAHAFNPTSNDTVCVKNSLFAINANSPNPASPAGSWGINTGFPLSSFDVNGSFGANIRTSAGGTTGAYTDHSIVATSPGTVVLPAPVLRRRFSVRNASTGNVTVTGNIDGVAGASILLGVGQGISFHAVAATWYRSEDLQASPYVFVAYSDLTYALPGGFVNDVNRYNQVLVSQCRGGAQNWWDPGPRRFQPNRPGMYRVVASYNVFRGTTIEAGLTVRKNGVGQQFVSNFGAASSQITADVEMNGTTDYIDVVNHGGAFSTRTQTYVSSQLRIEWIRP